MLLCYVVLTTRYGNEASRRCFLRLVYQGEYQGVHLRKLNLVCLHTLSKVWMARPPFPQEEHEKITQLQLSITISAAGSTCFLPAASFIHPDRSHRQRRSTERSTFRFRSFAVPARSASYGLRRPFEGRHRAVGRLGCLEAPTHPPVGRRGTHLLLRKRVDLPGLGRSARCLAHLLGCSGLQLGSRSLAKHVHETVGTARVVPVFGRTVRSSSSDAKPKRGPSATGGILLG